MAAQKAEYNTDLLRSGSDSSSFAGSAAQKAASRLSDAVLPQGIFGEFAAAEGFHNAALNARDNHLQRSQDHHARLTDIASKGHIGAGVLTDTDSGAAQAIATAGDHLNAEDA